MYLDSTAKSLEAFMGEAVATTNPVYYVSYNDHTSSAMTPGDTQGSLNGVTDVTILAAPAASAQRQVTCLNVYNSDTIAHTVNIQKDASGTEYLLFRATLQPAESVEWTRESGWRVMDSSGRFKDAVREPSGSIPWVTNILQIGTAPDTIGYWYSFGKDTAFPTPWSPGAPGVNGRATNGTAVGDEGCIPIPNPASGFNYLTRFDLGSTLPAFAMLYDVLWVNSGLVATTITAQAIVSGAMPARDINGSTNGEGLMIGLLFTAAATNAGAIANATVEYTNSDGTAARVATLVNLVGAQIPVSPTIGTIVWFMLQAGDKGVRSIQGITLGTSLVSGSISLLVARPLAATPIQEAFQYALKPLIDPGIRLYNGTCAIMCIQASSVTATTLSGTVEVVQR